ncbi:hypothetical protein VTN00DRAFT_1228 [Thermoascus crustaceus]|uniref:uncharacterized protein n=1 Tax=Thermoascus crustaceus TaxID=5088 RepID=UPI003741FAA4
MSEFIHITLQGVVYSATHRSEDDNDTLMLFCQCLAGVSQELSFDVLYRAVSSKWRLQDDISNPFGDSRESLVPAVWIFNLDNDILTLHKKSLNRMIPLSKLREGPVPIVEMEPFELPPLPKFTLDKDFPTPTWEPKFNAATRQTAFIGRVLEDFSYQWRHVFRSRYNNSTFRRLACAILRIVTLDFNVKEVARSRAGIRGTLGGLWTTTGALRVELPSQRTM